MGNALRLKTVGVAVIYDEPSGKFLLLHNKRWNGFAFPMKHFDPEQGGDPKAAALRAVQEREFPLTWPKAQAHPLDRIGEWLFSEGVHGATRYDYHVYGIDPGAPLDTSDPNPDLRYCTYDELIASPSVTYSTQTIARALVEDRRVAAAVITRRSSRGLEFLLVHNLNYQYFFPAVRMKANMFPAQAAVEAVQTDLGYTGPVQVGEAKLVEALQSSGRFGGREGRFHFHLCPVTLPGVDLAAPGNALEQAIQAAQSSLSDTRPTPSKPGWGWFNADDLRGRNDLSPSIPLVLATLLQQ